MLKLGRRSLFSVLDRSKTYAEICSSISKGNFTGISEIDPIARRKEIAATAKSQSEILGKMVNLRQEESMAKLTKFLPIATRIGADLGLVPVPIGIDSTLMDTSKTISIAFVKENTWPDLYGAQACEDEVLKNYLDENSFDFEEKINRFSVSTDAGILNIAKRDFVLNTTLAAEWLHFCIRIDPIVPQVLQVLLTWLSKSESDMDEEIFVHFVIFFLVHEGYLPSLEKVILQRGGLPIPAEKENLVASDLDLGKIVGKFFQFMKNANIEEDLFNTFDGRVAKKADIEDFIGCPEKVCGSVQSCGFATTQGSLLFISYKEVLISAGDDGNQLCFLKSEDEINCIAAAHNEGIVVVGFDWGIQVCRLLSGQASCRSISRILDQEIAPKESSLGSTEKNFKLAFPVQRIAISANGRTIATVFSGEEVTNLHVYRLCYNQEGSIDLKECFHEQYSEDITEFGFSNEKLFVVRSKFVFIFNDEFNQTKVAHPGKISHIDWRLSDDDENSVFLTHSNSILRLWSGQENKIQLLASKSSPDMMFSFLNNAYYSHDDTDYLVGISRGNFHLWSVSNLKMKNNKGIKPVVISTLRMIPNIYPSDSLNIKMHIQVRPYLARLSSETPLKRASSMFSLSPSITNSISMASVGASQKIFVDVVDSDGNLVTLTLSSSTNSFGDTTSIKSLCQASGHPAEITTIDAHPELPVIATGDELGNVFIVKRLMNKAHHKSVFKFDSEVVLKWIQSPEEMTSEILVAIEKKAKELIVYSIIIDNGVMKRRHSWNLPVENVQGIHRSKSNLIISSPERNLLIDPIEEKVKEININCVITGIAGQQEDFYVSKQGSSLNFFHESEINAPICPSINISDDNVLSAGPGLIFSWSHSGKQIECNLHSSIHTGFELWEFLDQLTIELATECWMESPKAFLFEHSNLTSTVFFLIGRTILTVEILQQPPAHFISTSPKGKICLSSRFQTPGTLKRPSLIERLDLKHFIAICGKSLLLLESEPTWSRPSYSPVALQKIINLGKVNLAKGILTSFVDFFKRSVKPKKSKEAMMAEIFSDNTLSEIRPNMPPLQTLLDSSFGNVNSDLGPNQRRKSVMDPDTVDFERRLSEDLEKDLVLDFSSSESECSEDEFDTSEVTVSDILMRYRLSGITRSEQVTLEAIWECLNTVIPAGIDRAGTTFMLQWHHHRCITKYVRNASRVKSDLPSSAMIWAFHSESQAEIMSIIMESVDFSWDLMKLTGAAFWCKSVATLRMSIEKLSRIIFQKEKDPMPVIVWYSILGKEKILSGLFKSVNNLKMAQFFANDFSDTRWKQAALKTHSPFSENAAILRQ
ncbi:Oidioi.mRNA.OKI2018_I69.chr2.g8320.t1.cds [Oikopleura dioica]|uniref:Oidioi.mRNA.OKI2018_I69.chr2.g8320.t1.cds n=1 Tax=Oikopleura dioica TaxID=34765 RepID=A0ABN7T9C7_OIKDI|nr:Oidioi.mRNA.OKI2018_I69.chr2.g8320.t1.cds [Oikopleura dioica]